MRARHFSALCLILLFPGQSVAASPPPLPCGSYTAVGGIFHKLVFDDAGQVTLYMSGHKQRSSFARQGPLISIKSDNDYLLLRQDEQRLIGVDVWTKDLVYRRSGPPARACTTPPAVRTHAHNSCYRSARELHATSTLGDSLVRFEFCCKRGDSASCNALGSLSAQAHRELKSVEQYFRKACDLGFGAGCANLANIAVRRGNPSQATYLRKKACHYEHEKSCIELALENKSPPPSSRK